MQEKFSHNKVSEKSGGGKLVQVQDVSLALGVTSFATLVRAGFHVLGVGCRFRLAVGVLLWAVGPSNVG